MFNGGMRGWVEEGRLRLWDKAEKRAAPTADRAGTASGRGQGRGMAG